MNRTVIVCLWTASCALAQIPVPAEPQDPLLVPFQTAHDLHGRPTSTWWAANAQGKCGVDAAGVTLVPWLGRAAPRSAPWHWRLQSARLGDTDLLGDGGVEVGIDATRASRRQGLVTELWDLHRDGIAQSFLVAGPGPRPADLVLRGAITSTLQTPARPSRREELVFTAADARCALHYGAATAVDAHGHTAPVPVAFADGVLELRVPAAFVATAAFPLLVDPLVTFVAFDNDPIPDGPGVTDQSVDRVDAPDRLSLIDTHVRWASAQDGDLFLTRRRDDFAVSQTLYADLSPDVDAHSGAVAACDGNDKFLAAWSRGAPGLTTITYVLEPVTVPAISLLRIANTPAGSSDRLPRVGGSKGAAAGTGPALLVRLRDGAAGPDRTEVWGSLIDTTTGLEGVPFRLAGSGQFLGRDCDEPWVTRDVAIADGAWLVAWQEYTDATQAWRIAVRKLWHDGTLASGVFAPTLPTPTSHAMQPRIEGSHGRYLLAFATASSTSWPGKLTMYGGDGVHVQRLDWHGNTPTTPHAPRHLAASFARDLMLGGLAHDQTTQSHWLVAHGPLGAAPLLQRLGFRGRVLDQAVLPGPTSGTTTWRAPALAFDRQLQRFPVLYGIRWLANAQLRTMLWGGRYEHPAMAAPVAEGNACGAGSIGLVGPSRLGTENALLTTFGSPAQRPAVWALSFAPAALPLAQFGVPGGCPLLVDPAAPHWLGAGFTVTSANGYAAQWLSFPEGLLPADVFAQCLVDDGGNVRTTARLHLELR